jgi:hypothetical protein
MLWGWEGIAPLLVVPALVGCAIGLSSKMRADAALSGLVGGTVGTALAAWTYTPERILVALNSMPGWMFENITDVTFTEYMRPMWMATAPVSAYLAHRSLVPMLLAGIMLVPAFALGASELRLRPKTARLGSWMPWVVVLLAASCLVASVGGATPAWFAGLNGPWTPGTYFSDMAQNIRTNEIMRDEHKGYYTAYIEAFAQDGRAGFSDQVAEGKFKTGSAAMIRQPAMLYLWRLITLAAPGAAIGWVSVVLGAAMIPISYWGLRRAIGTRALFVGFMVFPGLALWSATAISLEPEWWGVLCLLGAFFALVRRKTVLSLVLAFAAVLFRETTGVWLLVAIGLFSGLAVADRRWWRLAAVAAGLLAANVLAFWLHVQVGSTHIIHPTEASTLGAYLASSYAKGFAVRSLAPLSYLMLPYGLNAFPPVALLPLALVGFWVGLARAPLARLQVTGYVATFAAYLLAIGATSSYWGMIVTPFIVIGAALLAVSLDRLGSRRVWRFARPT